MNKCLFTSIASNSFRKTPNLFFTNIFELSFIKSSCTCEWPAMNKNIITNTVSVIIPVINSSDKPFEVVRCFFALRFNFRDSSIISGSTPLLLLIFSPLLASKYAPQPSKYTN